MMFSADFYLYFYVFIVFFTLLVGVPAGIIASITTEDRERKR